jgi:hypothetical protein
MGWGHLPDVRLGQRMHAASDSRRSAGGVMAVWVLEGFGTDSRHPDDIRHREYTSSRRTAELFEQIPRIQFTDSGHGIVFQARPHSGRRRPVRHMEYVREQMRLLRGSA